jgi:DNA-binding response OmpR family regulator
MPRLLLVEDEERLARSLCVGLRDEGYAVDHARDGDEALWLAAPGRHDALILDLRLPGIGGLEVCRRLRARGDAVPVLVLTACDATPEVVAGLDAGADDYVTKPFSFDELLARLRALLRRGSPGASARLCCGDLEMDLQARRVWRAGREVELTNLEFRLLERLLRNAGRVQSKLCLAAALWDDELGPKSNVLEVLVSSLRRKLDHGRPQALLHTRRGQGYLLDAGGA